MSSPRLPSKRPLDQAVGFLGLLFLAFAGSGSFCSEATRQEASPVDGWVTAGANPQRTSWVPHAAPGALEAIWVKPPHNVYAMWQYARAGLADPATVFKQAASVIGSTPPDSFLEAFPHVHNAYLAGYVGYVELAKMAGEPYVTQQTELTRLWFLWATLITSRISSPPSRRHEARIAKASDTLITDMRTYHLHTLLLCMLTAASDVGLCLDAENQPPASPEVSAAMQPYLDSYKLAGFIGIIADRTGKVRHKNVHGYADVEAKKPICEDNLFWIASMTKMFAGASIMMLADEGKVSLDNPVTNFIPQFSKWMVVEEKDANDVLLRPLVRPVTIRHLLSHTIRR